MTPPSVVMLPVTQRLPHPSCNPLVRKTCPTCRYKGSSASDGVRRDWYLCNRGWTDVYVVCRLSKAPADCVEAPTFLAGMSALVDEAITLGVVEAPFTPEK